MSAGLDWLPPGVLPPWANAEPILRGLMATHGIFSLLVRPFYRDGLSKISRDRLILTASAAVGLWAAVGTGAGSAVVSFGRCLPWVRKLMLLCR